jgi:uncharacterized protein YbaP (TraB family)
MKKIILFPLLLLVAHLAAQKPIEEKTLLWRISGNGIKTPSYLYGTMHLRDSRIFNFYDSLYTALEQCSRFAMEMQPDSLMNGILQGFNFTKYILDAKEEEQETNKSFNDYIKKKLSSKKLDSIRTANGGEEVDFKKMIARKRLGYSEWEGDDKMPVFMDAWLYNVARNQGKQVSGLEDVADNLRMVDEMKQNEIEPDILLSPGWSKAYIEDLIAVYQRQEIQKMYDKTVSTESAYEQQLFIQRNLKMLASIEKLITGDNLFIAVGAAHLAGDSGLIRLLRGKGYSVEPVYSAKRKAAVAYRYKKQKIAGHHFTDTAHGYSVVFPYQPAPVDLTGTIAMQVYFNLGSGHMYMSIGNTATFDGDPGDSIAVRKYLTNRLSSMGAVSELRPIRQQGATGLECYVKGKKGDGLMRTRLFYHAGEIYVFLVWAGEKKLLQEDEVASFLNSAIFYQHTVKESEAWQVYKDSTAGFSLLMPVKPDITDISGKSDTLSVGQTYMGMSLDMTGNAAYLFNCTRLKDGYYFSNDTAKFNDGQQQMINNMKGKLIRAKDTIVQGYRARSINFEIVKSGQRSSGSMLLVSRTGLLYAFLAMQQGKAKSQQDAEKFFNSIIMEPYNDAGWLHYRQDSLGFEGWLPSPFQRKQEVLEDSLSTPDSSLHTYYSYNKAAGHTYYIYENKLSPYFWASNDSVLWSGLRRGVKGYADSLVSEKDVRNGNAWGKEWLVLQEGGSVIKRKRILFYGNRRYEISANINVADNTEKNVERFFSDFKITTAADTSFIRSSKATKLLGDLKSADSVVQAAAAAEVDNGDFSRSDLPQLYNALLYNYPDSENQYEDVAAKLKRIIEQLKDDTTSLFAQHNYYNTASIKGRQYLLLSMILKSKTQAAADVCKNLLLSNPPVSGNSSNIMSELYDTIQLVRNWYPDILKLSNDPYFRETLWNLTRSMLDSNLVPVSMVQPYEEVFYKQAVAEIDSLKADADYANYYAAHLFEIVAKCNTKRGNEFLKKNLSLLPEYVRKDILVSLAANNVRPDEALLQKMVADDSWRYELYKGFTQVNKAAWFPAKYATQQQLAKSYLFNWLSDDYTPVLKYTGERTALFEGKPQRFYLFKVSYVSEEDEPAPGSWLVVCGPFSLDKKNLNSSYKIANTSEDEYKAAQVEKLFRKVLDSAQQAAAIE